MERRELLWDAPVDQVTTLARRGEVLMDGGVDAAVNDNVEAGRIELISVSYRGDVSGYSSRSRDGRVTGRSSRRPSRKVSTFSS